MPDSIQRILRQEGRLPIEVGVFLQPSIEGASFYCFGCGKFTFNHQHRVLAIVQDDMSHLLLPAPVSFQCHFCGNIFRTHIF